jgi:hypothetical protein
MLNNWSLRGQKKRYDEDDEWANFSGRELNSFLEGLGTVAENIKIMKRSMKKSGGKYYLHKTDLSELLIALRQATKRIGKNVPLNANGKVLRKPRGKQESDPFVELLEAEREKPGGIEGQGPYRA